MGVYKSKYTGEEIDRRLTDVDSKVAMKEGKGLSTNDYTDEDKEKVSKALTEHQSLNGYAKESQLPTKVSELENDKGYLTEHQSLAEYAKSTDLPTKVSELENDKGYISEAPVKSVNSKTGNVALTPTDIGAAPQSHTHTKAGITDFPTNISAFTNDANYSTKSDVEKVQSLLNILNGDSNTDGSVKKTVAEAIAKIVAGAPEDFDTLKEIADYIASDKTGAAEITATISQLQSDIKRKVDSVTGKGLSTNDYTDTDKAKVAAAITEHQSLDGYAKTADMDTALTGKAEKVHTHTKTDIADFPTKLSEFENDVKYALDTAVVKTSAQELTDEQAAQARENIGAGRQTDVERIQETLGHYTQRADIVLTAKETGVAISSDGVKVSKSGWAIAEFVAEKGVEYLFKPGVTDGSVCIFAQMITSKETRSIDYTYTYNDDGNVATATATYNGATHTYTFSYDEETGVQTITDESGTIVSALPYQYETSVGSYLPMTRLNAGAELPEDGYCRLMSHFQGNASLKVVVSYKVGSADLTMRVVKDGVFASVATQLGNLSGNISSTQSALASVEQDVASLDTFVEDNPSIGQYDFPELPLLCGQPPILQGYGTPQESVVPINWKQYDPDTDEGYDWTGRPSALNQQYINLSATTGGNYIAVWEDEATRELKWKAL